MFDRVKVRREQAKELAFVFYQPTSEYVRVSGVVLTIPKILCLYGHVDSGKRLLRHRLYPS